MSRRPLPDLLPLLLALCLMAGGTASAQIVIGFASPGASRVATDFDLKVNISSKNQLESVQAEFGGGVIPMPVTPSPAARVSIAGFAYGSYELTVTARDIFGTEAKVSRQLQVDRPPRLVVESPHAGAVARTSVHFRASCEDDGPQGCQVKVWARIQDPRLDPRFQFEVSPIHLEGSGVLDMELCLAPYVGKRVHFTLSASDGSQSSDEVQRVIPVNDDARLTEVASVPGTLLDYDAQRILFVDEQRRARVMDRASGRIDTLLERLDPNYYECGRGCPTQYLDIGYLVPGGAFFFSGFKPLQVQDGQILALPNSYGYAHQFAGHFLTYTGANGSPLLHDFATGTTTSLRDIVDNQQGQWLDPDGSVLWTYGTRLSRYRNGRIETLRTGEGLVYFPRSDGDDVVFNVEKTTVLLHGDQRHVLADNSSLELFGELSPLLSGGWVAFVRTGGGVAQVWTRSPTGVERQVTALGSHSWPTFLWPDGTVVYVNAGQSYLAAPDASPVRFSLPWNRLLQRENGSLHTPLNGSLFRVDLTASGTLECDPGALMPGQKPEAQGCGCTMAEGGSAWCLLLALLRLGARRARRAGRVEGAPRRLPLREFLPPLLALLLLAGGTASAQIKVSFSPNEDNVASSDFVLAVITESANQISSVQAEFNGTTYDLPAVPGTKRLISIEGVAHGRHLLKVTVRDVRGQEATVSKHIKVDRVPRISVQAPLPVSIARPSVRIAASCEDDGPEPCQVRINFLPQKIFESFDEEVCLKELAGKYAFITVNAYDGQWTSSSFVRVVAVEDSPRLVPVTSVPGDLLDFDAQRLLFVDEKYRARVMDRATGNTETLLEPFFDSICRANCPPGLIQSVGHLVPGGAVLLKNKEELFQIRDGRIELQVFLTPSTSYQLAGTFLLYSVNGQGPQLRNLTTGETTALQGILGGGRIVLADNGTVYETRDNTLVRVRQGQSEVLVRADGAISQVVADGDDVVFNVGTDTVVLTGGQRQVIANTHLGAMDSISASTPRNLLKRGWVAFSRLGGGIPQVWVHSPEGVETQLSFFGSESVPLLLGPDGTVLFENKGPYDPKDRTYKHQYYLAAPKSPAVAFARVRTAPFKFEEGGLSVALAGTVYRVDPTLPADPLECPPPAAEQPPEPPRRSGCTSAGDSGVWLPLWTLLGLGIRRSRRAGLAEAPGPSR